jgi:hypothetical protein
MQSGVDSSNFQLLCNGGAAGADVFYQLAEPNAARRILVRVPHKFQTLASILRPAREPHRCA